VMRSRASISKWSRSSTMRQKKRTSDPSAMARGVESLALGTPGLYVGLVCPDRDEVKKRHAQNDFGSSSGEKKPNLKQTTCS
jgi:hypothetical protein